MTTDIVRNRWVAVDHPGWRQAHAPTLTRHGGMLLAAWFAGSAEGGADTRIWGSRLVTDGSGWTEPTVLADGPEAHWNPVLTTGPDAALWLFYKRGQRISRWQTWYRRSTDGGQQWSPPAELVPGDIGGRGPVRNPPVTLPDGTWLAPASVEQWHPAARWEAFVDVSSDQGATWTPAPIPVDRGQLRSSGLIQPALWVSGNRVIALLRSSEAVAYRSESADGGHSWQTAQPTSLPNNNSALCIAPLPDGRATCVHNPVAANWGRRCPLAVSESLDDGRTWREVLTVDDGSTVPGDLTAGGPPVNRSSSRLIAGDAGVRTDGVDEYSYPSAVVHHGTLVIAYTWQRRGIAAATIPLHELDTREDPRQP